VTGAGALASLALNNEWVAVASAVAVVGILVVNRLFGHAELSLVGQRLASLAKSLLRVGNRQSPREMKVRLQGSVDWQELWDNMVSCAFQLNLTAVRLDVNAPAMNEGYHARWDRPHEAVEGAALWRAEVPLLAHGKPFGRLEMMGAQDEEPVWQKIAQLARLVEEFEETATLLTREALKPALATGRSGPHKFWPEQVRVG